MQTARTVRTARIVSKEQLLVDTLLNQECGNEYKKTDVTGLFEEHGKYYAFRNPMQRYDRVNEMFYSEVDIAEVDIDKMNELTQLEKMFWAYQLENDYLARVNGVSSQHTEENYRSLLSHHLTLWFGDEYEIVSCEQIGNEPIFEFNVEFSNGEIESIMLIIDLDKTVGYEYADNCGIIGRSYLAKTTLCLGDMDKYEQILEEIAKVS